MLNCKKRNSRFGKWDYQFIFLANSDRELMLYITHSTFCQCRIFAPRDSRYIFLRGSLMGHRIVWPFLAKSFRLFYPRQQTNERTTPQTKSKLNFVRCKHKNLPENRPSRVFFLLLVLAKQRKCQDRHRLKERLNVSTKMVEFQSHILQSSKKVSTDICVLGASLCPLDGK